jgi:hypothetical protein
MGLRRLPVLVVALFALFCASAQAKSTGIVAHLDAPTHSPTAGERWPIKITVHDTQGHRLRASVRYAYLYKGEVVSRAKPKDDDDFVGIFRDNHLTWSKRTIGLELTFRAVVDSHNGQANLDYDVKVER